jgi:ubiquinone/menaquinone biosynthesis C-methylase UbiE
MVVEISETGQGVEAAEMLILRDSDPHRPSVENRVAYQWEMQGDVLGFRNGARKDGITLAWLAEAVQSAGRPASVLDVGCAYGNFLLMLNAMLGKPADVELVGVDLHEGSMVYGRAFAEAVPGYQNCRYEVADLSQGLPFEDDSFDAISLNDVLEHMDDPAGTLRELMRVVKPGGAIVISTPLRTSLFKRLARIGNRLSRGRLYRSYYRGKNTELDESGKPVMVTKVGNDHVSEMSWRELKRLFAEVELRVEKVEMMPVMSGSRWFDRHGFILSGVLFVEALHDVLRLPSWAHSVCVKLSVPSK